MIHENTDLTIYSEQYQQMAYTLPTGSRLEISESVKARFREWLATQQICDTHRLCQIQAHYDRRIDELIINDVFTPNMKTVWTLTEPYVGMRSTDIQIIQARETHKTLKKIIHYIKEKLCKINFADELRARRESELRARRERERIHDERRQEIRQAIALANSLGVNNVTIHRPDSTVVRYVINRSNSTVVSYARPFVCEIENSVRNITEEEANKEMEDDCAICASKHNMVDTCALTCGHQFGIECLTPWIDTLKNARKPPTCPCCRNKIKKIIKNRITPDVL